LIQELVLVLDGRNGFGLASFLFGASVFWVPPVAPKWVPKRALRPPVEARVEVLCVFGTWNSSRNSEGVWGGKKRAETGPDDELQR